MRAVIAVGWLMVALGVAMLAAAVAAGFALFGVLLVATVSGSGLFTIGLARGCDQPLERPVDLHRYGRPANATVRKVADARLNSAGMRTAELSLQVTPSHERSYTTRRRVVLPEGRIPSEGETVTIKFDPHARREFVLLEGSYDVSDRVQRTLANLRSA